MLWRNRKVLLSRDPRFAAEDVRRCVFDLLAQSGGDVTTLKLECWRESLGIMCEASVQGVDEERTGGPKIEPELRR